MTRSRSITPNRLVIPSVGRNLAAPPESARIPRRCAPRNDRRGRSGGNRQRTCLAGVLALLLLVAGCREQPIAEPNSVSHTAERGPFALTVEVTPAKTWVGDPVIIEVRVQTPEGYVVQFPGAEDLGELEVRSVGDVEVRPGVEGGLVWRRTITAESLSSGVVELPSLVVKYAQEPAQADAEPVFEHELATDPFQVEVRSALTTQDSVLTPRDITGVLTPPKKPLSPWSWAAIIGGLLTASLGIAAFAAWLRRRAHRPAPPVLPEVWALRALSKLEAADLIDRGQAKEFYYRLSEIVRLYIELKFGLAAPEMTTEEFLLALARNRGALPYDAERLRDFLQACDLVKYAALRPRTEDAGQALGTARAFIDATAAAAQQRESGMLAVGARGKRGGHAA
jgi:hypothetical protein